MRLPIAPFPRVVAIACSLLVAAPALAAGGNALDRINFGDAASEQAHQFDAGVAPGDLPPSGVGALGQTYRAPYGSGDKPAPNQMLRFTLAVDPAKQTYVTVRLWGGDQQSAGLWLQGTPREWGDLDWNGGPPPFPNRFYYDTLPIPLAVTQGKTTATLQLYENNTGNAIAPGRPVYSAYSHVDPCFLPDPADATGLPPTPVGQITPAPLSVERVTSLLQANRQALYGPNGYYDRLLARQILPGTAGAPPETVGLDLNTSLADFGGAGKTADQWRDQSGGHGRGPGYSTMPDELLSVLTSTYLLPPFKDANGKTVAGLDHYHDAALIPRIVLALDASTYLQSSDGGFNDNGWDKAHNVSASGVWQGLTSSPRMTGHPYAGSTTRGPGWSLSLEGPDTATLGWVTLRLLDDPTAAPVFKRLLGQSFDADLNGGSMLRATAYERMLSNELTFQKSILSGGTVSQALFNVVGLYSCQVALEKLQVLYPNPAYPALPGPAAIRYVREVMGIVPVTSLMGNLYQPGQPNYAISRNGLGEARGTSSGGYDGRYGTILPWVGTQIMQMAAWDPAMDAATLGKVRAQARAATDAYAQFISPLDDTKGTQTKWTLAQEDFITYRDPYNPNANAGGFTVGPNYLLSDPTGGVSDPLARRAAYLEALYGITPGSGSGGNSQTQFLKKLSAYEASVRSLINVAPANLPALPGEPGQPDHAWVDVQTGAAAVYYHGERFYLNANWRNADIAGKGNVSHLARIHDTTRAVDRAALVFVPFSDATVQSDGNVSGNVGQPWAVRFGSFLILGNDSGTATTLKLPPGTGTARDLLAHRNYSLGAKITIQPGQAAVVVLPSAQPTWAVQPKAGPSQPVPDGTYTLTVAASGLCLEPANGATTSGTRIVQQTANREDDQQWVLTSSGNGFVTVKNAATGLYLTDAGQLQQGTQTNAEDQQWQPLPDGPGFVFVSKKSGQAIDDPASSTRPGEGLGTYQWGGNLNQILHLSPARASR